MGDNEKVREGSQCDSVDRGIDWAPEYFNHWIEDWTDEDEEAYREWKKRFERQGLRIVG